MRGQFAIQIIIVLICFFTVQKKGGIALGLLGGIGILMLVFTFHIKPGKLAIDVMLQIAERILRRNPKFLTILAPFCNLLFDYTLWNRICGLYYYAYYL